MSGPLLPFLLRSLKYPHAETFNPDDLVQYQALVVWLENTRVRAYPIDGRGQLQSKDPAAWQAALQKYLSDLECPLKLDGSNQRAVLQWLLQHAVGLEYTDAHQQLNQLAQRVDSEAGAPEDWSEAALPPFPDITTDAVRATLLQLQQLLHVQGGSGSSAGSNTAASGSSGAVAEATPEGLQRAHAMLETCVLPALAELAKQQRQASGGGGSQSPASSSGRGAGAAPPATAAAPSQHAAVAAMLAQYPLGFSTGDGGADLAATILRMLYIKDLRALQTLVDSAIVQLQEYTANPRTDASLGKVGR